MCDKEIDLLLLGPRLHLGVLDVSVFLSPLPVKTDNTCTSKTNTAGSIVCPNGEDGCLLIVYVASTSFAMFTTVAKTVQVSVCWAVSHMVVRYAEGK